MAAMDISRQRRSLLDDATALDHLPAELLEIIKDHTSSKILDAASEAALIPLLAERVFVHFEATFPDICARWILNCGKGERRLRVASALTRLLPFAPYLSTFLDQPSAEKGSSNCPPYLHLLLPDSTTVLNQVDSEGLLEYLVTIWRLLSFDLRRFGCHMSPAFAQGLFSHDDSAVRYVAIRIFCQLLHASDHKLESLIKEYVGKPEEAVNGILDGVSIDYGFLTLHEHARVKKILALQKEVKQSFLTPSEVPISHDLTPYVVSYGEVLLPRPYGPTGDPSNLVQTESTTRNLQNLASMLRNPDPVLLHGLPGSGKTSLVHEVAKQLGMYDGMVTLHLNEQTDAKMLVGLYSTDTKPGSFQWRPGVLTTAVREGRWVLVEDLDRAPTEVLSTLLPLIERNELLIPSRGERIHAASTFRLFATLRTSRGMHGRENLPSIVGMRFWQLVHAQPMLENELQEVMLSIYPILRKFIPGIMAVYTRLSRMGRNAAGGRSTVDRPMNLRDLLKWCRRLHECLSTAGSTSGDEPISETTRDWMFMEALDCFVGSSPNIESSSAMVRAIAEEMHLSTERAEHYLSGYIPPLEENDSHFNIGRVRLRKQKLASRIQKSKRPFASTAHAKKLLEQIATAVKLSEPVLLVGETGIGKTTVVQQLAESLGHKLNAVNLSQQSEVGDLLGGFKPVNVRTLAVPLKEDFEDLFAATGISASKNQKYFEQVGKSFAKGQWSKVSKLWKEAPKMFNQIVEQLERTQSQEENRNGDEQPTKRRKTQSRLQSLQDLRPRWKSFSQKLEQFDVQISGGGNSFAFSFMEGNLVKAVRNGDWVLLDEINLASPDTLESIADLLTGPDERPSILLSETGEIEKIVAHPNFRIFGAMNPATDIGKRDLPTGIRSRFTELYVRSPDNDLKDLLTIIKTYLGSSSSKHDQAADDIARLYLNTKRMAEDKRLVDGANEVPHFSLRTLTRVLSYVNTIAPFYGLRRALYEGFSMGFLTLLDRESEKMLLPLIHHHLFEKQGNAQSMMSQPPKHPNDGKQYVKFTNQSKKKDEQRQYWLFQGREPVVENENYIITPYVERNLLNLVRATSTRRFPILIQGPTSAGKTSMIEYLANYTGNKFVRINNHEHTDLQEYLGTYVSGADGKLRFQEGILVQAMRQGHWIVLDELNLAPTDVLEALNRLLDDNRELLIPETQEVVRPHENFILFATQNPPGLYGGRKVLSRAFRNRFLELHYDDIPEDELEYILQKRSRNTSPPDCRRIVSVYKELSRLRQTSRLFEQKDSFATLRDLFRWALREAESREEIAAHGFMLLAERVRDQEERMAVKEVIEKVFKVTVDPQQLYSIRTPELRSFGQQQNSQGVVWTQAMRRLYVLVSRALKNNEPVLLVGETGCGKTTVCQLLAEALKTELHIVNAHQNTETGDLIGSQRPVRNRGAIIDALNLELGTILETLELDSSGSVEDRLQRYNSIDSEILQNIPEHIRQKIAVHEARSKALFEWSDGALVEAMRNGHFFLLDEISLADDSVLERLNSVLEPQRTLLLAEKGIDNSFVAANNGFQLFATMNPGGDFGKKELSPALRNRFTEIWVPPLSESEDIYDIVRTKLTEGCKDLVEVVVHFAEWFGATFRSMSSTKFSIREILVWVQFINNFQSNKIAALVHGAATIFIDSIGANPSAIIANDGETIAQQRQKCLQKLSELAGQDVSGIYQTEPELKIEGSTLTIGDFSIPRSPNSSMDPGFAFHAPTTRLNGMRVLRALQMQKPILLEGSPGVGKTTLVAALARACGQPLTRINLSDQTDLMDLFGTDVPVEGAEAGNFAWRDAPFLQAMQKGEWVLLDEMNLASQSVLEGLNACLDHRGEVYISELDQVFKRHPDFRLFAAQNPHHQGGGRKGLPSSFVNRFVVVYADIFTHDDLQLIAAHNFPQVSPDVIKNLIQFITRIEHALVTEKSFGSQGGPWEFNLRDVLRWLQLLSSEEDILQNARMDDFLDIIVRQRFRSQSDRDQVNELFASVTGVEPRAHSLYHNISSSSGQVGLAMLQRNLTLQPERLPSINVKSRLPELETLIMCVKKNIPCILSSPSGYGKTVLLEHVAALSGNDLVVFPMNADIDTMDLVGGFEQADPLREINATFVRLRDNIQQAIMGIMPNTAPKEALQLLHLLESFNGNMNSVNSITVAIEALAATIQADSPVGKVLTSALTLLGGPLTLVNPRFEWLDGVIVKALQTGQWLVLDNANMCNASVLDRLNSLLEPNGCLSINEHCEPGGEPRIVKPHPNFRIFLTVDPRYGELSRAMRNRAVEISINSPPPVVEPCFARVAQIESGLQRFKTVEDMADVEADGSDSELISLSMDALSQEDITPIRRFVNDVGERLCDENIQATISQHVEFFESSDGHMVAESVYNIYGHLPFDNAVNIAQPIHTMTNIPVTRLLPLPGEAEWIGVRYEFSHALQSLQRLIDGYRRSAQGAKLASLNRLERSLLKDRVASVSKDSTVNIAGFLSFFIESLSRYLAEGPSSLESWKDACRLIRLLERSLYQAISLAVKGTFDEARFLALLSYSTDTLRNCLENAVGERESAMVTRMMDQMNHSFTASFKLSTGLSMELLWKVLRPVPFRNEAVVVGAVELEQLAARFDALRWKTSASIKDLCNASTTLEKAYNIVKTAGAPAADLVAALTTEVKSLEDHIKIDAPEIRPYFVDQFEHLRQLNILQQLDLLRQDLFDPGFDTPYQTEAPRDLSMLADTPTKLNMVRADGTPSGSLLHSLNSMASKCLYTWDGKFVSSLWSKLQGLDSVSLSSMALLETEMPILGRHLAWRTPEIASNPLVSLNDLLWELVLEILKAHNPQFGRIGEQAFSQALAESQRGEGTKVTDLPHVMSLETAAEAPHLREVISEHFIPALGAIVTSKTVPEKLAFFSALAWNHVSVGALRLYVPDKVFDPQIRPQIERESFEDMQSHLNGKIKSLQAFEQHFTGQDTNARIELLQEEVSSLGPLPPAVQPVFRPEKSELSSLHAEFTNILKAAGNLDLRPGYASLSDFDTSSDALQLVKENVTRLVSRLSSRFEAYQDMTQPTIGLLRCLLVGLSLCEASSSKSISASTTELTKAAPFFGGSLQDLSESNVSSRTFEFLDLMSLHVSILGIENIESELRESIFKCFHALYDEWNKKLEADRKAEAENTSLYQFKGSAEDEDEVDEAELNELFPGASQEEMPKPAARRDQVRDTSIRVAKAHSKLFLEPQDPQEAISSVCRSLGRRVVEEADQHQYVDLDINCKLLTSSLLLFDEKRANLMSSEVDKNSYNFYASSNPTEARLLVTLVNKIKARFLELQLVDEIGFMEPLANVIAGCDTLLEALHTDPLSTILPRVEQVHTVVYEWQFGGWASHIYGALELYNALTETVVRWRRLELSTWAKLLDMEQKKCEDDAYSWWFIAYQVVIAVPLTMVESSTELREYSTKLVQNLELYFHSSIIGQFSSRLALLRQLRNHLQQLDKEYPTLEVISDAVANFIDFYSRYETASLEGIQRGRAPIDKKMKDVLLMASWKDTNINALRESARKSHHKLFRLVRKFRRVLGQQTKIIIEGGLPDQDMTSQQDEHQVEAPTIPDADLIAELMRNSPDFAANNRRLANSSKTVSIMSRIAQSPEMATDVPSTLDSLVSELNSSIAELRKETPQYLNDENKEQIKYLKTQKRKLFADTLKDLRLMGIRHNLSQDRLAEQESLAVVLASIAPADLSGSNLTVTSQYYLHKVLDLAPKVRAATREHSEELSAAEVARSVGFVEGMVHMLLSQRRNTTSATINYTNLQSAVGQIKAIADNETHGGLTHLLRHSDWAETLPWLVQVLKFSLRLVEIYGRLAGADETRDRRIEVLSSWTKIYEGHHQMWQKLPAFPPEDFTSLARNELEDSLERDTESFKYDLAEMTSSVFPNEFALLANEIQCWLCRPPFRSSTSGAMFTEEHLVSKLSKLCDTVLVAVEAGRKAGLAESKTKEDPGWLIKHDEAVSNMLKQLHMQDITAAVLDCIEDMSQVQMHSKDGSGVVAVMGLALPILEQYANMCRQSVVNLLDIHRATGHMSLNLTKIFTQMISQGFCTPQEKSNDTSGADAKTEGGTGLGEGEGAEDISKDIKDDEDLTELAQEANKEDQGEIEDEKDAVDMADEDMEGEMGSAKADDDDEEDGDKDGDEEEEDNDMDEEAGDVDDLDPTAVDEKMWDGKEDDEKADKDQKGEKPNGQKTEEEQLAADDEAKKDETEQDSKQDQNDDQEPDLEEEAENEDEEVKAQDELSKQEQTAQEQDKLDLPEEMDLDFDDKEELSSDSDDDLDLEDNPDEHAPQEEEGKMDEDEGEDAGESAAQPQEQQDEETEEVKEEPEEEAPVGGDEVDEEVKPEVDEPEVEENKDNLPLPNDDAKADENAAQSEEKGSGLDQQGESHDMDENAQNQAQQDDGDEGSGENADKDATSGGKGQMSRGTEDQSKEQQGQDNDSSDSAPKDPFKKLGDALENWHRQQEDIKQANPEDQEAETKQQDGADQSRREFQHLQNDDAAADDQAMGTADDDQVQPIDDAMAIDEEKQDPNSRLMDEDKDEEMDETPDQPDETEAQQAQDKNSKEQDDQRSGVKTRQGNYNREQTPIEEEDVQIPEDDNDDTVEETSTQLSTTHISSERELRDFNECMQQWAGFQSKTHSLSLSLTSQLRLILTPSQSTKLSGSFRTGKRLNIKRIIPYIASSYKRDKIWMRRSIPTKRTYQILLCVDDSQSMGESSSGNLAMESLVMVSRSLTMLEAGQVGVVGFGSEVFTAHNLTDPFAADSGAKVLQNFNFSQDRTDIALLIRQTIDTFRTARQQQSGNSDLWQLSLILSDGLTPSSAHDNIRRLLREAIEERIMIVFIIMDDTSHKKGDSVLELKEAKFVNEGGESRVVIERYLDTFPFQYYLIVHNLEELPGALAGLLRTWFAEVAT